MKKLYKKTNDGLMYAEAWVSQKTCYFHHGKVGEIGETLPTKLGLLSSSAKAIEKVLRPSLDSGYAEIPDDQMSLLFVHFDPSEEWGTPEEGELLETLQEALNDRLGRTGAGRWIGNGDCGERDVTAIAETVDREVAVKGIVDELSAYGMEEVTIRAKTRRDNTAVVLWTPADSKAKFAPPPTAKNENEWQAASYPESLQSALDQDQLTVRKCRQYGIACCQRVSDYLVHPDSKRCLEYAKQMVDGKADAAILIDVEEKAGEVLGNSAMAGFLLENDLETVREMDGHIPTIQALCDLAQASQVDMRVLSDASESVTNLLEEEAANILNAQMTSAWAIRSDTTDRTEEDEKKVQAEIFRDIFVSPYKPPALDSQWRTPQVIELATEIYQSNNFSRLGQLAQLLQQAGCNNPVVISHCENSTHVRGCWLVDWCLGQD